MVKHEITLLNKETIDQIAAGEVVERPASVVKELVENSIDAGANAITVEIKDGGKSYIRITDNGCGIPKEQLSIAFLRHSTSKLRNAEELANIRSLGFRGEALSSIGAVSRVEMITKPQEQWMGCRYVIEGSQEIECQEVGAPNGTTIKVYQLFYNTPARLKFLKSDMTEAGYISELMERLALSHPEISFCFISNKKEKLHTSGNNSLTDTIYQTFGSVISSSLTPVSFEDDNFCIDGFFGNPTIARGNRSLENFYINGRYIRSPLLARAIERGYTGFLMQHQYPFFVINIQTRNSNVDVNVHPTKQEVRFDDENLICDLLYRLTVDAITKKEDIAEVEVENEKKAEVTPVIPVIEPFEKKKLAQMKEKIISEIHKDTPYERKYKDFYLNLKKTVEDPVTEESVPETIQEAKEESSPEVQAIEKPVIQYKQTTFLSEEAKKTHRIIGQVFDTYWLVEFDNKLYIIDQHAAHEKVMYEKMMKQLETKTMTSQQISPPVIVTLSRMEQQVLTEYMDTFTEIGFSISSFGGNEYSLDAVPGNLYSINYQQFFMDLLSECAEGLKGNDMKLIREKVASMACKAAVKGNQRLSMPEIEQLISDLLALDNPYHCPHGRPTIIAMSQYELEKKFKRIV